MSESEFTELRNLQNLTLKPLQEFTQGLFADNILKPQLQRFVPL